MSLDGANLLLDTGILIHLCRGGEAEARLQARYGLRELLSHLVVLNLRPGAVPNASAELDAHLSSTGQRMGQQNDLWIAATARATGATILTTDRDFDVLHPHLVQREWVDPAALRS